MHWHIDAVRKIDPTVTDYMNYIHIRNLQWYDSKMINLIFFPAKCNLNIPFRLFIRDIIARNTHTLCVLT